MRTITKMATALCLSIGVFALTAKAQPVEPTIPDVRPYLIVPTSTTTTIVPITFKHGDCSWVEPIALSVGWEKHHMQQLIHIIKRESGCCPRRIGGSVVDKNCNFIRMATMSHPSDSGLLQINGVHWKQDHKQYAGLACKRMSICSQQPLLDPKTNLAFGRLLYEVAGWKPWTLSTK
jgi:hypothetical protein